MSRFIRSALFPILIVIVVAMFIEWVIQGKDTDEAPKAIYSAPGMSTEQVLTSDLQAGVVKSVVIDPQSKLAQVTQLGGVFYVAPVADPAALEELLKTSAPRVIVSQGTVAKPPAVPSFTNDVINGRVQAVVMNTKDQSLTVTLKPAEGGKATQYTVGYTDPAITTRAAQPVPGPLRRQEP